MAQQKLALSLNRRQIVIVLLLVAVLYVLLPQLGDFRSSWHLVRHPNLGFTALAAVFTFLTYGAAAGTYCFLAFKLLSFGNTAVVQLAAMFINRLLPAGIGALGANYLYLRRERHSEAQAAATVAMNNTVGMLGHGLLVAVTLAISSGKTWRTMPGMHGSELNTGLIVKVVAIAGIIAAALALYIGRRRFMKTVVEVKDQFVSYGKRPLSLIGALSTSLVLTLCNVLALFYCLHALGLYIAFPAVLLVFTLGVSAGAAVPTPGGLGGFEAGLAAGFVAYGLDPAPALAAALLYRLVSYWLPLIVGAAALLWCQHHRLFHVSAKY